MSVKAVLERGGPRKLLALDGGGVRGLITVEVLGEIEDQLRSDRGDVFRLSDEFDYIAGTSTGVIIATCLWPDFRRRWAHDSVNSGSDLRRCGRAQWVVLLHDPLLWGG